MSFDVNRPLSSSDPDDVRLPFPPSMDRDLGFVPIRTPQDLLSFIPYLLQYQPHDVLVVVFTNNSRSVFSASMDLPSPSEESQVWNRLAPDLDQYRPDSLYLIAYAPDDLTASITECARIAPVPVDAVLRVHDGLWWRLGPDSTVTSDGTPLVPQDHVVAPLTMAGLSVASSWEDLTSALQPAPPPVLERVQAELVAGAGEVWTPIDRYRALWAAHQVRLDGPVALDEVEAARLLRALSHVWVRDACLDWHDEAAWWLWSDLVRFTPPRRVPTVAMLLAGAAYQRGHIALAMTAADHALRADPGSQHAQAVVIGLRFGLPSVEFSQVNHEIAAAARTHLQAQCGRSAN